MGIADDISPRRKQHTSKSELDSLDSSARDSASQLSIKEKEEEVIFKAKPSGDDDFFASPKTKKKSEIVIEPKQKENENDQSKFRFSRKLILFIVLVVLVILIAQNFNTIKKTLLGQSKTETSDTGTNSVEIVPQNYTSGTDKSSTDTSTSPAASSATGAPSSATTTSPATTAPVAATSATPDKSTITIDLLNGNGINSTAATYKAILTKAGYTVSAVGNAANFHYWSTYVYYKTGLDATAADIKTVLKRKSVLLKNDDTICKTYDIVIIIGSH